MSCWDPSPFVGVTCLNTCFPSCTTRTYVLDFTTPDMQRIGPKVGALNEETHRHRQVGLRRRSHAAQQHRRGPSDATITDGPYAEVKEHMGGFWIINVADDAEARNVGTPRRRAACEAPIELRPLQDEGSRPSHPARTAAGPARR